MPQLGGSSEESSPRAVPLVLTAFTLTCQSDQTTPVAPDDVGIRAAPGGEPGKPPKDGGGVGAEELGYEIVVSAVRVFTQAPESAVMSQACPDGKVAIGGGYDLELGSEWHVLAQQIASSGAGLPNDEWRVSIQKGQGEARNATVFVLCING